MFKRILIANRGEIACRIIASCRRLGIGAVAVYSEADAQARHVRLADQALLIGPAAAAESYLSIERLIAAARASGAEAIHPGYGFLAENASFARALREAGLVLIGPTPETMDLMGSKAAAKARMAAANVPLIPGYHGEDQAEERLAAEAEAVGYPLMLKAAAGGGGKGMRVVHAAGEFAEALKAARREAAGAFGDDRMILERYLPRPRHIEAQIFGDSHGQVVHLFERDCSSQRRHQKIIEEAPAAGLDEDVRAALLDAAVRAADAVDYVGAGTVEFLVDGREFFFLEMNTRLQVEHPVTELITGQDLVEWQIRVAAGQPLPLGQDQIRASGHAMEARIYAEDPARGFVPSSGRIDALRFPSGHGLRVDSGVEAGDMVSVHYDPMIAKLIVHDADRDRCRARLAAALAATSVVGPTTNLGFLQQLADAPAFAGGGLDTGLLDRDLASIVPDDQPVPDWVFAAAACHWLARQEQQARDTGHGPWSIADGWRLAGQQARSLDLECGARRLNCAAVGQADAGYRLELGELAINARLDSLGESQHSLALDQSRRPLQLFVIDAQRVEISVAGQRWRVLRHERFEAASGASAGDGRIIAPMPGKVIEVRVAPGDRVEDGQTLAVMEAMKMELAIKAPFDGTVDAVAVAAGDLIEADSLLLQIKA